MRAILIVLFTGVFFLNGIANSDKKNDKKTTVKTKVEIKTEKKEIRKYDYDDFVKRFGQDDTSKVIIDLFLRKRNAQGVGEMTFLPITAAITFVIPPVGIALSLISLPMAAHGGFMMSKYSKKRLAKVLADYNSNKKMNKRLMKKVKKHFLILENEEYLAQTFGD